MDKYEQIEVVGEGSYGLVMKCRHRETDQLVAVKKFLETEDDSNIRRMALREIRMLKRLRHENLVTMIEVFRHRKRFYIVFEFVEGTVLDEMDKSPGGLGTDRSRDRIYQVTRAVNYCHNNYIIHRDVKPENVLISSLGVVKLCDFGFARLVSPNGEPYTEYVATRWYRAPELLVGDVNYSGAVDVWAIGCLFAEMMTGDPLFPGDSDIDQMYLIVKMLGKPCTKHQQLMSRNSQLRSMIKSSCAAPNLSKQFPDWPAIALDFLTTCMRMDPYDRLTSDDLLKSELFSHDKFPQKFLPVLREKVNTEFNNNPLLRRFKTEILMSTDKKDELTKQRRQLPLDGQRWKFNMPEGGMKRKYTEQMFNNENLITLSSSSARLNVFQPSKGSIQSLERSLAKIVQKAESNRALSAQKRHDIVIPALSPSTPKFQSLQVDQTAEAKKPHQPATSLVELHAKTTPAVLKPSINNLDFAAPVHPVKKPNSLTQVQALKSLSNVPVAPQKNFPKKLDAIANEPNANNNNSWAKSFGSTLMKKKPPGPTKESKKIDDFTLPNLPGDAFSNNKSEQQAATAPKETALA